MKLQDYLHYYMGCKVMAAPYGGQNKKYEEGKLVGINIHDVAHVKLNSWQSVADISITCVKPILRRFEDITKEQMKAIWGLIFDRPFNENGRIDWFEKETFSACKRWIMWSGVERVGIELNGKVWADSDLHNYKYNPHVVTHYLLQQQFDLFGLIDAGLAVDIKTTAL